jgi:hypothetical protein
MDKNITLVAIDFLWHDLTRYAIETSLKRVSISEIITISDREIISGAKFISHKPVNSLGEYANIMLKEVVDHVNTSHALYVQWDGMAYNKFCWDSQFLDYDYIGAPWPFEVETESVGNGGFSLRSKKLLEACRDNAIQLTEEIPTSEDKLIGYKHRPYLEDKYNIKFPSIDTASHFSFELGVHKPCLGFHGLWNVFNLMPDETMDYYASRITYKDWELNKWRRVLEAVLRRKRFDLYKNMLDKVPIDITAQLTQSLKEECGLSESGLIVK